MIRVFISHSSHDAEVAKTLAELIVNSLRLEKRCIRCTSADGYRLPAGANTDEQLRREVLDCEVLIGLVSRKSFESAYVLFELGARWGKNAFMAPVLAPGVPASIMQGPLSKLNALSCSSSSQVHQLVHDVAAQLDLTPQPPSEYDKLVQTLTRMDPGEVLGKVETLERTEHHASRSQQAERDEYPDAEDVIRRHCERRWADDFSMRAYCENEQREAVAKLRVAPPDDIPSEVFGRIRAHAASRWPDDFSMRLYAEREQLDAYRQLNRER